MEPPGTAPGSEPSITGAFIAIVRVAPGKGNIGAAGAGCKAGVAAAAARGRPQGRRGVSTVDKSVEARDYKGLSARVRGLLRAGNWRLAGGAIKPERVSATGSGLTFGQPVWSGTAVPFTLQGPAAGCIGARSCQGVFAGATTTATRKWPCAHRPVATGKTVLCPGSSRSPRPADGPAKGNGRAVGTARPCCQVRAIRSPI